MNTTRPQLSLKLNHHPRTRSILPLPHRLSTHQPNPIKTPLTLHPPMPQTRSSRPRPPIPRLPHNPKRININRLAFLTPPSIQGRQSHPKQNHRHTTLSPHLKIKPIPDIKIVSKPVRELLMHPSRFVIRTPVVILTRRADFVPVVVAEQKFVGDDCLAFRHWG